MIVRHDRLDSDFQVKDTDFPAVLSLDMGRFRGVGTLVHPEFVVTAAHTAEKLGDGQTVVLAGAAYQVAAVHLHPTWLERDVPERDTRFAYADLALLRLTRPVRGVVPIPMFEEIVEPGQVVTLLGNGRSGTGLSGGVHDDGRWRKATNRIEARHGSHWFSLRFDAPDSGTDLEGIPGVGDSGGPALVEVGGAWRIIGVASWEDSSSAPARGQYGTMKFYASLSAAAKWVGSISTAATEASQPRNSF